jgi:hypothetical protein
MLQEFWYSVFSPIHRTRGLGKEGSEGSRRGSGVWQCGTERMGDVAKGTADLIRETEGEGGGETRRYAWCEDGRRQACREDQELLSHQADPAQWVHGMRPARAVRIHRSRAWVVMWVGCAGGRRALAWREGYVASKHPSQATDALQEREISPR